MVFFILFFVFIVFVYDFLIYYFITIDKTQADAVDIGITIRPNPVRDNVIEPEVAATITNVSNDFSIVVIVLNFYISFLIC